MRNSTGTGREVPCVALQSFKLSSTGALSFLGATQFATETQTGIGGSATLVKLSGNGSYAYSASYDHGCFLITWELKRESSGAMLFNTDEILTVPSTPPGWRWYPFVMTADPTNHMAVAMMERAVTSVRAVMLAPLRSSPALPWLRTGVLPPRIPPIRCLRRRSTRGYEHVSFGPVPGGGRGCDA